MRACRTSLEQAQQELQATSKIVLEMRNILQRHGFTDVSWAMFLYSSVSCCLLSVACCVRAPLDSVLVVLLPLGVLVGKCLRW